VTNYLDGRQGVAYTLLMPAVQKTTLVTAVHVTADRLFAHVFADSVQICFENDGAKLEPHSFEATAAHTICDGLEVALADIPASVKAAVVHALSQEIARIIDVSKPRKLTTAQVQRIYGRAID